MKWRIAILLLLVISIIGCSGTQIRIQQNPTPAPQQEPEINEYALHFEGNWTDSEKTIIVAALKLVNKEICLVAQTYVFKKGCKELESGKYYSAHVHPYISMICFKNSGCVDQLTTIHEASHAYTRCVLLQDFDFQFKWKAAMVLNNDMKSVCEPHFTWTDGKSDSRYGYMYPYGALNFREDIATYVEEVYRRVLSNTTDIRKPSSVDTEWLASATKKMDLLIEYKFIPANYKELCYKIAEKISGKK